MRRGHKSTNRQRQSLSFHAFQSFTNPNKSGEKYSFQHAHHMQQEREHDLAPLYITPPLGNSPDSRSNSVTSIVSIGNSVNESKQYRVWFEEYTTGLERDRHMSWLQKRIQTIASHVSKQACNEYHYDHDDKDDEVSSVSTDINEAGDECDEVLADEGVSCEHSYSVVMTEALLREVRARPEVRQVCCE